MIDEVEVLPCRNTKIRPKLRSEIGWKIFAS